MNLFYRIVFFGSLFVIAFLPGGIIAVVILLVVYYAKDIFSFKIDWSKQNKDSKNTVIEIELENLDSFEEKMSDYSQKTKEEMR